MPSPGDILLYQKYRFEDGSEKDKLFVALNAANTQSPCLVLKTTSQSKKYSGSKRGCDPARKVFYVPKDWNESFDVDTYIELPHIVEFSVARLIQAGLQRQIRPIGCLSSNRLAELKNCLKKFKKDLSPRQWKLIFKS